MKDNNFIKFVIACSIAATVNFCSRIFLGEYVSYITSIVVAYLFGMITAYTLCRLFVFTPVYNSTAKQMLYFTLVNGVAVIQTIIISLVLTNYFLLGVHNLHERETIAHFFGVCAPILTSYFGHKLFSFK